MATIDSQEFIEKLINGGGRIDPEDAPDNPWATKITRYINMSGRTAYGVVFEHEAQDRYNYETEFIRNPVVIWTKADGRGCSPADSTRQREN